MYTCGNRKEGSDETAASCETSTSNDTDVLPTNTDDAELKILPLLQPPSEEEADFFYYGLPSLPRLMGRASAGISIWENLESQHERWRLSANRQAWFLATRQALASLGDHAIRRCWTNDVQPGIIEAIGRLPWTSVDVFRIGNEQTPPLERPVVVWVGVEHAKVPWRDIAQALRACRRILDAAELGDVDCQVRVSSVIPLVGTMARPSLFPPEIDDFTPDLYQVTQPFTTAIGQSFFPLTQPDLQGTLGVYLGPAPSDKNDKNDKNNENPLPLWALTCRHVGLPHDLNPENVHYHRQDDSSDSALPMGIPGQAVTEDALATLLDEKNTQTQACENLGDLSAEIKTMRLGRLKQTSMLYDAVKEFEPVDARQVGSVYLSPPIGQGLDPVAWTRDWCLVELDRNKFPNGDYPTNVVDLRTPTMPRWKLDRLLNSFQNQSLPKFYFPEHGLLRIIGVIPLSEIRNPPGSVQNAEGDECILVGKRGATTGLTWGSPSELMSTVRNCMPSGGGKFVSQEWAIHGSLQKKTIPFSAPGDSGAAVFGIDGRLGGFITRGTDPGEGRSVDITYATPAALVLADVEEKLGQPVVVL